MPRRPGKIKPGRVDARFERFWQAEYEHEYYDVALKTFVYHVWLAIYFSGVGSYLKSDPETP